MASYAMSKATAIMLSRLFNTLDKRSLHSDPLKSDIDHSFLSQAIGANSQLGGVWETGPAHNLVAFAQFAAQTCSHLH